MAYRYKLVRVEERIDFDRKANPLFTQLWEGSYVPPEGARVVGMTRHLRSGTVDLLLEYEFADGDPYR